MALIGGGHEVGAAHAKCSGYVGAWTSDPLTWTNEFFPDLMQDDWTWYEACSYENGTMDRCGMTGGACASGTTCVQTKDASGAVLTEQCEPDGDSLPQGAAGGATKKKTTRRRNDPGLIVAAAVSSVATLVLAGLVAFYACRRPAGRDLEGPVEIKTPPHEETKHSA